MHLCQENDHIRRGVIVADSFRIVQNGNPKDRAVQAVMPQLRKMKSRIKLGMQAKVRKDTYELFNSIEVELDETTGVITAGSTSDHATSQEYGRPDLHNYGYTPFLRPTLEELRTTQDGVI